MEQFGNVDTEWIILVKLLKDAKYLSEYGKDLFTGSYKKKCYFTDPKYQILANLYYLWFNKYKVLPQEKERRSLIERVNEDEDIKLYLNALVDKAISDETEYSNKSIQDEISSFIFRIKLEETIGLIGQDLDNEKYNEAKEKLRELSNYNNKEASSSQVVVSNQFDREAMRAMMEEQKNIPKISSGYRQFDNVLNGGFKPSKIYVFAGIAGGGKSILLLQFAINAVKAGKKVLFISYEMDNIVLQNRINLNLLPEEYNEQSYLDLKYNNNAEEVLDDITEARKQLNGEMTLVYPQLLGQTAHDIEPFLQDKDFDMLVVDYIGIMDSNTSSDSSDNPHFKFKAIAEELRSLSKIYEIPILTANQLNAEGYKKGELGLTNMAYSNGINHTVDLVAIITPDGNGLKIAKSRDGNTPTLGLVMNKPKYQIEDIIKYMATLEEEFKEAGIDNKDEVKAKKGRKYE